MKTLEKIDLPTLTKEQVENLCTIAEETAREYIFSQVPPQRIHDLDITVETEGLKPMRVSIDVKVDLSPILRNYDAKKLVEEAVQKAFEAVETHLRQLKCQKKHKRS